MSFYFSNYFYFSKTTYSNEITGSPYLLISCPYVIDILVESIRFSKFSSDSRYCNSLMKLSLYIQRSNEKYYLFKDLDIEKNLEIKENLILISQDKLYVEFSKDKCINYVLNYKYLTV